MSVSVRVAPIGGRVWGRLLFGSKDGSIDGATTLFDATRAPVDFDDAIQQVGLSNIDSSGPVLIESLSGVDLVLLDGPVTWTVVSDGQYRISFKQVCWEKLGEPGWTVECAEVADATIELQFEPTEIDAGAVGVSSWVTSAGRTHERGSKHPGRVPRHLTMRALLAAMTGIAATTGRNTPRWHAWRALAEPAALR